MTCALWQKVIDGNLIFSALGPGIWARFLYHSKTWKAYRPTSGAVSKYLFSAPRYNKSAFSVLNIGSVSLIGRFPRI